MFSNERREEMMHAVREGTLRLELDDVSVVKHAGSPFAVPFRFAVEVSGERFVCRWRLQRGQDVPDELKPLVQAPNRSITSPSDSYEIFGRTENGMAVRLTGVRPFPSTRHFGSGATHYETTFDQLHLPAEGSDALDTEQQLERIHAITRGPTGASLPPPLRRSEPEEELLAIIPAVELQIRQPGTETRVSHPLLGESITLESNCFLGHMLAGTFCLEDAKRELLVHFRRPVSEGVNAPSARTVFDGLLAALGYTHGCHPWPTYLEHRKDARVVERWFRPHSDRSTRVQLPISAGRLTTGDGERLFAAAAAFFSSTSEEAATFRRALWLMREAIRYDMAFEIRLITLCSIFEGLLHKLANALLTVDERALHRSKRWPLLIKRLGLPWDQVFERAFESWEFYRHPLAHGFQRRTSETNETVFYAYSRLGGAIHMLMAKRMGFAGRLDVSPLETDNTVEIK